jgi:hypothetical protein
MILRHSNICISIVLAGMASAAIAQETPSADDPYWIADAATGCLAANPSPLPNETIVWSGDCVNGLIEGEGVLTWYQGDSFLGRDTGNFAGGMLSGRGRIEGADGWYYEGAFPGSGVMGLADGGEVPAQAIRQNSGWQIVQTHEQAL